MAAAFEVGLFLPSTRGGTIITDANPPEVEPTWDLNQYVTRMAEEAGLDFVFSQVKWRGFGGPSQHWDAAFESLTLMAGLAAVTKRIKLFASVAIRTINPAVVAKMAATIDAISSGRFGLNIVAGWNKYEYAQMGLWSDDDYYLNRYEYAQEYLSILKALWTQDRVTFKGKFFDIDDCTSWPKPSRPLPIICAGQSDGALDFVARESDFGFVGRMNDTAEQLGTLAQRLATLSAAHQRSVGAYTLLNVIAEDTTAAAEAKKAYFLERRDDTAIKEFLRISGLDANRADYAALDPTTVTFMSVPYIAASYDVVAAHLDQLAENGIRGVAVTMPDFENDAPTFIENVVPRMKSRATA